MIKYHLSTPHPHRKYLQLEAVFPTNKRAQLELQLPSWRPGRYELGNFAKNIRAWSVVNEQGQTLDCQKIAKDRWKISTEGCQKIQVRYQYYAAELNAGSTFIDPEYLYVNPVNCFLYDPENPGDSYEISFQSGLGETLVSGMEKRDGGFVARGFQQLMDSPFLVSKNIDHWSYEINGVPFHIWIQGRHKLDKDPLIQQFEAFTKAQMTAFGSIPCEDYHFIFLFPDFAVRHGVEHENSTVIALGPAEILCSKNGLDELLGISCHELYHTWNIKNIRPIEMMPYDFSRENYSRLGYVAEGVTTYFGEQFLWRSEVFDDETFYRRFAETIQKHSDNYGRFNLSVADASFDTWLDGYVSGSPWRKVSIYVEGSLSAFITDVQLMKASQNKYSLDDAMKLMYERFGQKALGYSEKDYRGILEELAGEKLDFLFEGLIWKNGDYLPLLKEAFTFLGLKLSEEKATHPWAKYAGVRFQADGKRIAGIAPDSPGDLAGLWEGDEIISVQGYSVQQDLALQTSLLERNKWEVLFKREGKTQAAIVTPTEGKWFQTYRIESLEKTTDMQKAALKYWKKR